MVLMKKQVKRNQRGKQNEWISTSDPLKQLELSRVNWEKNEVL